MKNIGKIGCCALCVMSCMVGLKESVCGMNSCELNVASSETRQCDVEVVLMNAIQDRDVNGVKAALDGSSFDQSIRFGSGCVRLAIDTNQPEILELLVNCQKVEIPENIIAGIGSVFNLFEYVILLGRPQILEVLVGCSRVDVPEKIVTSEGKEYNIFELAILLKDRQSLKALVDSSRVDVHKKIVTSEGKECNLFELVMSLKDRKILEVLVNSSSVKIPESFNFPGWREFDLLSFSVCYCAPEILETLLTSKEVVENARQKLPSLVKDAVSSGKIGHIRVLLDTYGDEVRKVEIYRRTPLELAMILKFTDIVELLEG